MFSSFIRTLVFAFNLLFIDEILTESTESKESKARVIQEVRASHLVDMEPADTLTLDSIISVNPVLFGAQDVPQSSWGGFGFVTEFTALLSWREVGQGFPEKHHLGSLDRTCTRHKY